ncbi:ribonuclease S-6-like [Lycium barbarum]|uniref:ribonuclease S-6-like n=1 Tax=Lycium barbarum TaxID=112863 RepID=UPI00293E5559|nr:ribonuclease S-6-like [Lycium barbarum]
MKKLPFFLLILLLVINSVYSQVPPPILKFVLQWPPTFCIILNSAQNPGRCKEPIPQHEFPLHGLWPADARGESITCTQPPDPNWDQVFRPIENQLMAFWPTLREGSNKRDIWKHEWRVHGACGGTTPQVYFNRAIKINNMLKGNLFNYFKTNGIIACDSLAFSRDDIVKAVQKVFNGKTLSPYLSCTPIDSRNKTHVYLNEVTLCTNSDGTSFISCPSQTALRGCLAGAKIMLPHPKAQKLAPRLLRGFQEETDGIYYMFKRSWAKYIFNG